MCGDLDAASTLHDKGEAACVWISRYKCGTECRTLLVPLFISAPFSVSPGEWQRPVKNGSRFTAIMAGPSGARSSPAAAGIKWCNDFN